jgi:hypothetical protein
MRAVAERTAGERVRLSRFCLNISASGSGRTADRDPAISPEQGHRYKRVIVGFGQRRGGGKGGGLDRLFCRI